jgi:hypothetical protein
MAEVIKTDILALFLQCGNLNNLNPNYGIKECKIPVLDIVKEKNDSVRIIYPYNRGNSLALGQIFLASNSSENKNELGGLKRGDVITAISSTKGFPAPVENIAKHILTSQPINTVAREKKLEEIEQTISKQSEDVVLSLGKKIVTYAWGVAVVSIVVAPVALIGALKFLSLPVKNHAAARTALSIGSKSLMVCGVSLSMSVWGNSIINSASKWFNDITKTPRSDFLTKFLLGQKKEEQIK